MKEIQEDAFYNTPLTKVIIPDSVINIGANAFSGITKQHILMRGLGRKTITRRRFITFLTLGAKIETIGYKAFAGNQLTVLSIPFSVHTIENEAFIDNPLEEVDLSKKLYDKLKADQRIETVFGSGIVKVNSATNTVFIP